VFCIRSSLIPPLNAGNHDRLTRRERPYHHLPHSRSQAGRCPRAISARAEPRRPTRCVSTALRRQASRADARGCRRQASTAPFKLTEPGLVELPRFKVTVLTSLHQGERGPAPKKFRLQARPAPCAHPGPRRGGALAERRCAGADCVRSGEASRAGRARQGPPPPPPPSRTKWTRLVHSSVLIGRARQGGDERGHREHRGGRRGAVASAGRGDAQDAQDVCGPASRSAARGRRDPRSVRRHVPLGRGAFGGRGRVAGGRATPRGEGAGGGRGGGRSIRHVVALRVFGVRGVPSCTAASALMPRGVSVC
jgi:hypothetical protein